MGWVTHFNNDSTGWQCQANCSWGPNWTESGPGMVIRTNTGGSWNSSYQPTHIRITGTTQSGTITLSDNVSGGNVILSQSNPVSGTAYALDWVTNSPGDMIRLNCYGFSLITNIEFFEAEASSTTTMSTTSTTSTTTSTTSSSSTTASTVSTTSTSSTSSSSTTTTTATVFYDPFTGSNGDPPASEHWTVLDGDPEIQSNKLQFNPALGDPGGDRAQFQYTVSGDIDVYVDFDLSTYPSSLFWRFS